MCIAPKVMFIPDKEGGRCIEVPCRKCWQCTSWYRHDWEGRCIAESKMCVGASFITLTYGRDDYTDSADHPKAVMLTYSDVQKYFKLLRRHGFPLRFFCAGEYGSRKGRAHWHILAFWSDVVPGAEPSRWFPDGLPEGRNFMDEFHWPLGWSYWKPLRLETIKYAVKYVGKSINFEAGRQQHAHWSAIPPLGAGYFQELAKGYVLQGLAPQDLEYRFGGLFTSDGKPETYWLFGKSKEVFLDAYLYWWGLLKGEEDMPPSDLVEEYIDGKSKQDFRLMEAPKRQKPVWLLNQTDFAPIGEEGKVGFRDQVESDRELWERNRVNGPRVYTWANGEIDGKGKSVGKSGGASSGREGEPVEVVSGELDAEGDAYSGSRDGDHGAKSAEGDDSSEEG